MVHGTGCPGAPLPSPYLTQQKDEILTSATGLLYSILPLLRV